MHLRALTRQAEPRSSRPIGGGCCLADCHELRRLRPISRLFSAPLHTERFEPRTSVRRHQEKSSTPPQDTRGSASPKGEARRKAPARRSAANAAPGTLLTRVRVIPELRVGVGDSVGAVGRDQPTAGGVRAGWCNQAAPRDPPRTRPPPHPRQHKPNVDERIRRSRSPANASSQPEAEQSPHRRSAPRSPLRRTHDSSESPLPLLRPPSAPRGA